MGKTEYPTKHPVEDQSWRTFMDLKQLCTWDVLYVIVKSGEGRSSPDLAPAAKAASDIVSLRAQSSHTSTATLRAGR